MLPSISMEAYIAYQLTDSSLAATRRQAVDNYLAAILKGSR